jgi:hypothetical protein
VAKPAGKERRPKYRAYVAFLPFPNNPILKVELVAITDERGRLVQGLHGPSPISDLIDASALVDLKRVLRERFREQFDYVVSLKDIHILPFDEVDRMLFKRENK